MLSKIFDLSILFVATQIFKFNKIIDANDFYLIKWNQLHSLISIYLIGIMLKKFYYNDHAIVALIMLFVLKI